jgi:hypothetical protein
MSAQNIPHFQYLHAVLRSTRLQPSLLVAQRAGGRGHHGALSLQPAQHRRCRLAARGRGGRVAPERGRLRRQAALLLARLGQRFLDELPGAGFVY